MKSLDMPTYAQASTCTPDSGAATTAPNEAVMQVQT